MDLSAIRQKCWDKAVHAHGTGYIFEERARALGKKIRLLAFLGIAVPASIGGIVLAFGTDFECKSIVLVLAGIIGIVQLIVSVWALVADWQDAYAYAHESLSANHRLAENFESLASNPPSDISEVEVNFRALMAEDKVLNQRDYRQEITPEEKREGMRAALRKFQRECASCGKVSESMSPSDCDVCGNF